MLDYCSCITAGRLIYGRLEIKYTVVKERLTHRGGEPLLEQVQRQYFLVRERWGRE